MKSCRISLLALAIIVASCAKPSASIVCTVEGAPDTELLVRTAGGTVNELMDTVRTDASGSFRCNIPVQKGNPEFVYVMKGERKLASAVLDCGDKVTIKTDTLGRYSVEGSEDSSLLKEIETAYASYLNKVSAAYSDGASSSDIARIYIDHYRSSMKFLLEHKGSIALVPLLMEGLREGSPTFSQLTDAIVFRNICDTLSALYPDSRYVKSLEKETARREGLMSLQNKMEKAGEVSHPAISLPSMDGTLASLDNLDAKVVLLHFWSVSDATHKLYNQDVLKPVYQKYHPRGLEIYAVCIDPDKVAWGQTVKIQELPWVNVNDGLGTASSVLRLYNVQTVPTSLLVTKDAIIGGIDSESALRRELDKIL